MQHSMPGRMGSEARIREYIHVLHPCSPDQADPTVSCDDQHPCQPHPRVNCQGPFDLFTHTDPPLHLTTSYMANFSSPSMNYFPNEYWGNTSGSSYPLYVVDNSVVDNSTKARCMWDNCDVILDDISHAGVRRHFRDYHHAPRGERLCCKWGGCCRSEEMLFENIPKHIAECHVKSMAQRCPHCNGSFARKDTLKRHLNAGCPAVQGQQLTSIPDGEL